MLDAALAAMKQQKQERKGESCTLMFISDTKNQLGTAAGLANLISVVAGF